MKVSSLVHIHIIINIYFAFRSCILIEISYLSESSSLYNIQRRDQVDTEQTSQSFKDPIVEVITPDDVYNKYGADSSRNPFSGIWSRTLRVKITGRDGFEKLDLRIPVSDHTFLPCTQDICLVIELIHLEDVPVS